MPELPEVELVCSHLNGLVTGRRIVTAELRREKLSPESTAVVFAEKLREASIASVHRRGKHVLFDLANGRTLITHLRMSGRFMLLPDEAVDPKFAHAVFFLDDSTKLIFDDQRHFGLMRIVETSDFFNTKELAKLAPEPFGPEFSVKYFRETLRNSRRTIKEFLLDQTKVCGVGNIYASEAMFLARIDPRTAAYEIGPRKAAALFESIREILNEAINLGRTIGVNRENIGGSIYGNGAANDWRVYDREGEPCPNCNRPITRLKQAGRSTYFCRRCQRK